MIVLFLLLLVVAGFGLTAAWLGEHPGNVTMVWFGYQIETSMPVLMLAVIIGLLLVTVIYHLLRNLFSAPSRFLNRRHVKHYKLALAEITQSVAALAASDIESATKHTKKTEKLLGTTPLTLLLRAQISKSSGSDEQSKKLLEQLLQYPETEYLAAKSLADVATKQERVPQALTFAKRAHDIKPKEKETAWSVFNLHLKAGKLDEAESHAHHARKSKAFSKSDMVTALGKITYHQALRSHQSGHLENALFLSKKATRALPGDLKAAELNAELFIENQQPKKAVGMIQKQWLMESSPRLVELFHDATLDEKPERKEKLIQKLIASNPAASENILLERTL